MIKKLKVLLSGSVNENWNDQILTEEEFEKAIETDFSIAYNLYKSNDIIYRGDRNTSDNFHLISPKLRKSAGGLPNIYTTLFSEILPSWSKYPKRNHCIIGATDIRNAVSYGKTFIVLPINNTKLGVTSRSDLWFSFRNQIEKYLPEICNYIGDLKNFDENIEIIFNILSQLTDKKYILKNKEGLIDAFKDLTNIIKTENGYDYINKKVIADNETIAGIFNFIYNNKENIFNAFNELFDPDKNGIKLIDISQYNFNEFRDNEVWFDNKCIMFMDNKLRGYNK